MGDLHRVFEQSLKDYPTITKHLHKAEKAEVMTHSAILPMSPGSKPTEPGWYVATYRQSRQSERHMVEVIDPENASGSLAVWLTYDVSIYGLEDFTFIARIYPEQIEGSEE